MNVMGSGAMVRHHANQRHVQKQDTDLMTNEAGSMLKARPPPPPAMSLSQLL